MERSPLLSPLGIPCNRPPWSAISAVDLDTGELRWQHPLGAARLGPAGSSRAVGDDQSGRAAGHGGRPVFIGATADSMFRAMIVWTGEVLWEHTPGHARCCCSGYARPMAMAKTRVASGVAVSMLHFRNLNR
jgi:quinoprotein glucose dehydrogenase